MNSAHHSGAGTIRRGARVSFFFRVSQGVLFLSFFLLGMPVTGRIPQPPRIIRDVEASNPTTTSSIEFVVWGLIYTIAIILVIRYSRRFNNLHFIVAALPLVYYLAAIFLSPYSFSPYSDGIQLIGSTAISILFARTMAVDFSGTLRLIHRATSLNLLLSLGAIMIVPARTISEDGRWSGLVGNPNYLAAIALLNVVAIMTLFIDKELRSRRLFAFIILPISIIIGTGSATSTGSLFIVVIVFLFVSSERFGPVGGNVIRSAILLGLAFSVVFSGLMVTIFLDAMGKDFTLTGRTDIWVNSISELPGHLTFGYGIGITTLDVNATNWPTHFHNGYLQITMYMGLFGATLFFFPLIKALFGVRFLRNKGDFFIIFCGLLVTLVYNMTEVGVFLWRNPIWLLYLTSIFLYAFRRVER